MKTITKYFPYIILIGVIAILIIRDVSRSELTQKQALQIQSERNKSAWASNQIQESKAKELQYITERDHAHDLAGLYKRDIERLESFIKDYKAKLKVYEKQDRININRLSDAQLDSLLFARFPQPDSVVFSSKETGGIKP